MKSRRSGIALARHLHWQLSSGESQRLTRVVLAEVDGLGNIGVSLCPVLAYFEYKPRTELKFALAQQIASPEEQGGTLLYRSLAPALKGFQCRLHRGLHMFLACLLMESDHLGRLGWIDGLDLVLGPNPLASNNQIVFTPKLATHLFERRAHLACIFLFAKIREGFVYKRAFMQANLRTGGSFKGCHQCTSDRSTLAGRIELLNCSTGGTEYLWPYMHAG